MPLRVEPSGGACGARVTGLDLAKPLDAETIAAVRAAWLQHHVLAFPDQTMGDDDLERLFQQKRRRVGGGTPVGTGLPQLGSGTNSGWGLVGGSPAVDAGGEEDEYDSPLWRGQQQQQQQPARQQGQQQRRFLDSLGRPGGSLRLPLQHTQQAGAAWGAEERALPAFLAPGAPCGRQGGGGASHQPSLPSFLADDDDALQGGQGGSSSLAAAAAGGPWSGGAADDLPPFLG